MELLCVADVDEDLDNFLSKVCLKQTEYYAILNIFALCIQLIYLTRSR